MPGITRTSTIALALAAALASAGAAAQGRFGELEWKDGVRTSRSGENVWVSVMSDTHTAYIPGFDRPAREGEHAAWLGAACMGRSAGADPGQGEVPAYAEITLANHPEHAGVHLVWEPMHWVLELTGQAQESLPVEVQIGEGPWMESTLVRARTNYSAPHPGMDIGVPAPVMLKALKSASPVRVTVRGALRMEAVFSPSANVRRAASLMEQRCPRE